MFTEVVELRDSAEKQQDALAKAMDEKQQMDRVIKDTPSVDPEAQSALPAQLAKLETMIQEKQQAIAAAKTDVSALQSEVKLLQEKKSGIQNKISINEQQQAKFSQLTSQQDQLAEKVALEKKRLQQIESKLETRHGTLARMEKNKIMPAAQRDILITDLIRPILRGLSSCPVFAVKTIFRPRVLETSVYLKVE